MTRRRLIIGLSLAGAIAVAFGGFFGLSNPLRDVEQQLVLMLLSAGARVRMYGDHYFQVLPRSHGAFRAQLTPFCSSLVPVLALAAIAAFILSGPPLRRTFAFACAAAVVMFCNVLRVAASVWVGLEVGARGLVLFHDWVGTLFGIGYTMLGFFLMLFLLLPRATASIPRAARVSDVL
jgi:carbamoyl-phosphate synthase large subunit